MEEASRFGDRLTIARANYHEALACAKRLETELRRDPFGHPRGTNAAKLVVAALRLATARYCDALRATNVRPAPRGAHHGLFALQVSDRVKSL